MICGCLFELTSWWNFMKWPLILFTLGSRVIIFKHQVVTPVFKNLVRKKLLGRWFKGHSWFQVTVHFVRHGENELWFNALNFSLLSILYDVLIKSSTQARCISSRGNTLQVSIRFEQKKIVWCISIVMLLKNALCCLGCFIQCLSREY